ncbi:Type I restriction modification DNA specificity domain protein [uncultured archaeon]|nr:Type I restriction modification DNA specificity domain protein [uncultured archaeon]
MANSYYYTRFFDEMGGRLDENYNNPRYDEINHLLTHSKYSFDDLGDHKYLTNIVSGKTPKGIKYLETGIPFLGSTHILFGNIDATDVPRIAEDIHNGVLASSKIKRGNVLVTIAGTIGRTAVYHSDDECNANQAVAILNLGTNEIDPEFLVHYLNSRLGQLFFGKLQHISSQPNINLEEIKKIKIIVPKKTMQTEILKKVNMIELQALKLEEDEENIRRESDSLLLGEMELNSTRQNKYFFKTGEGKSVCFYIFSNELSDRMNYLFYHFDYTILQKLQERYETEKLGCVCSEPIKKGEQPIYSENGEIAVIKTINLKNSYIDYKNCLKVSRDFYDSVPHAQIRKGDILIASTGHGSLGKVDVYDRDDPAIASVDLVILRLLPAYDPYFITYFLRSHLGAVQFEKWFSGSSGQIHIYEQDLNQFIIPKSSTQGIPMEKQKDIVSKITKKLEKLTELKQKSEKKWEEARALFEGSLLS